MEYTCKNWRKILFHRGFYTKYTNCAEVIVYFLLFGLIMEWIYDKKPLIVFGLRIGPLVTGLILMVLTFALASFLSFRRDKRNASVK